MLEFLDMIKGKIMAKKEKKEKVKEPEVKKPETKKTDHELWAEKRFGKTN
jgi:SepF-like predicted cell division protein (DUF552 family)